MTRHLNSLLFCSLLFLLACANDIAEQSTTNTSDLPSFWEMLSDHEDHELTIKTDLEGLIKNKEEETYQSAMLLCKKGDHQCFNVDLKVSSRGKTRKNYCGFPPLKLNFNKTDLKGRGLSPFDHYKLVTHCKDDRESEAIILKEYMVYRLYNLLTRKSLGVKLFQINYVDTEEKVPSFKKYAFVIESIDEFCRREQCEFIEDPNLKLTSIHAEQYKMLTLFQYMVGNTDWNLSKRHNIKLVKEGTSAPIPIPYDFDYCGLVNAPYAVPHPQLPIKNVRERLFQYRSKKPDLDLAFQKFSKNKKSILSFCKDFKPLDENQRTDMMDYINTFYTIIEDPQLRNKKLLKR